MTSTSDISGRQLPLVTVPARELGDDWLMTTGSCLPGLAVAAQKSWKNRECWQVWTIVGGVRGGAAEEDWLWDLNPGEAAKTGSTMRLWQSRTSRL